MAAPRTVTLSLLEPYRFPRDKIFSLEAGANQLPGHMAEFLGHLIKGFEDFVDCVDFVRVSGEIYVWANIGGHKGPLLCTIHIPTEYYSDMIRAILRAMGDKTTTAEEVTALVKDWPGFIVRATL